MKTSQLFPPQAKPLIFAHGDESQGPGFGSGDVSGSSAHIVIWGDIGGWFGVYGHDVFKDLQGKDFEDLHLWILGSPGGDVVQAFLIYDIIKGIGVPSTAHIVGLAASAATIISSSCDVVEISDQATFMIHFGLNQMYGFYTAEEIKSELQKVEAYNDRIVNAYRKKTSLDVETIGDLMGATSWMTPDQALELGFVDRVVDHVEIPINDFPLTSGSDLYEDMWFHDHNRIQSKMVAMGFTQFQNVNVQDSQVGSPVTNINSNHKQMSKQTSFGALIAGLFSGLGFTVQNKNGDPLTPETLTETLDGSTDLSQVQETAFQAYVQNQVSQIKNEIPDEDGLMEKMRQEFQTLLDPLKTQLGELVETLKKDETEETPLEENETIQAIQNHLGELTKVLANKVTGKSGGTPPVDKVPGVEKNTPAPQVAMGKESTLVQSLIQNGTITDSDWERIEEQAKNMRQKLN